MTDAPTPTQPSSSFAGGTKRRHAHRLDLRRDRGRRVHGPARPLHRQHRLPRDPGRASPAARPPRSRGCSMPTRSSSPPASCRPAGSPTCSAAGETFQLGLIAVRARLGSVRRWRRRWPSSSPPARCRRSARRCSSRPRSGCCCHAFPPARRAVAIGAWVAVGAVAAAGGPALGGLLVEVELAADLPRQPPARVAALVGSWLAARRGPPPGGGRPARPARGSRC